MSNEENEKCVGRIRTSHDYSVFCPFRCRKFYGIQCLIYGYSTLSLEMVLKLSKELESREGIFKRGFMRFLSI